MESVPGMMEAFTSMGGNKELVKEDMPIITYTALTCVALTPFFSLRNQRSKQVKG
jgi:hypothetical protein